MLHISTTSKTIPTALLDKIVNRYLSLDSEVAQKISDFEGKVIAIELQGINKTFFLFPLADQQGAVLSLSDSYDGVPDTVLKGSPAALFKMGLADDVAPLMLKGEVEITGDVRLGREFKKLLAEIDIDWEENMATWMGDVPAHQLAQAAKRFTGWASRAKQSITMNVSEYLQEESRDVVAGAELEAFYEDVDNLRNDVDRLEARAEALKNKIKN